MVGSDTATVTVTTKAATPGIYNVLDDSFTSNITFTPEAAANNYYETYDVELNIYANPPVGSNTIVIYGPSASYTFDNTEKSLSVPAGSLEGFKYKASFDDFDPQLLIKPQAAEAKGTTVGTYKLGLKNTDFAYNGQVQNLTIVYYDGALTITPKQITSEMITAFAPTSFMYNTKEQGPSVTVQDGAR